MRFVSATAILTALLLASCSGAGSGPGGTSTVAKQIVGHWSTPSNDHLYFGEIDPAKKTGSYILIHPDGKAFTHRYRIESEDSGDRAITIDMLFASGDHRETTYVISKDGESIEATTIITGIETQSGLAKVDGKTAP